MAELKKKKKWRPKWFPPGTFNTVIMTSTNVVSMASTNVVNMTTP